MAIFMAVFISVIKVPIKSIATYRKINYDFLLLRMSAASIEAVRVRAYNVGARKWSDKLRECKVCKKCLLLN